MKKGSEIVIDLDEGAAEGLDELTGTYRLPPPARRLRLVELSLSWYTEGAGNEDSAVHHFEQREAEPAGPPLDSAKPVRFSIPMPEGPHSYEGFWIKIRWRLRMRMVDEDGTEWTGETPVRIGAAAAEEPSA